MSFFAKTADALKVYARTYSMSPFQKKVYEATSNENWGVPNSLLIELAQSSNSFSDYNIITEELWMALNEPNDKWRRIYKGLVLLEYLLKFGSDRIVEDARGKQRRIQTFLEFRFMEDGKDRSGGIKEKAQIIMNLLNDQALLDSERQKSKAAKVENYRGVESSGAVRNFAYSGSGGATSSFSNFDDTGFKQPEAVSTARLDALRNSQPVAQTLMDNRPVQKPAPYDRPVERPVERPMERPQPVKPTVVADLLDFDSPKNNKSPKNLDFGDFVSHVNPAVNFNSNPAPIFNYNQPSYPAPSLPQSFNQQSSFGTAKSNPFDLLGSPSNFKPQPKASTNPFEFKGL